MDTPVDLKKFAALSRPKGSKEAYITRVILVESKEAAELWFGENNYEILGTVYRSGK